MKVHPDGTVEAALGSQDLGTGTRTVIAMVLAETFGLPIDAVKVNIGDSSYPQSGPSGGSSTVGGVSSSTRRAAQDALREVFAKVAPALGAAPETLVARGGRVEVAGDPSKSLPWKEAAAKIGAVPISVTNKNPGPGQLTDNGVGGVQMADVSVDVETGIVKINRMVAVQDVGLVINEKLATSQVYGALIMGVSTALYEERVADPVTGRVLNPNMEFYKLASIGDVGEFKVHLMRGPGYDERGVIGMGEPPMVSPVAAIGNAIANAIGVRVTMAPFTPARVLAALADAPRRTRVDARLPVRQPDHDRRRGGAARGGRRQGGGARRRHRPAELDEGRRRASRAPDQPQVDRLDARHRARARTARCASARWRRSTICSRARRPRPTRRCAHAADGIRSPQLRGMGTVGGELLQRPRCWYYRAGFGLLAQRDGRSMVVDGDNRYHAILGTEGPAYFVHASSLAPRADRARRPRHDRRPEGTARGGAARDLPRAVARRRARDDARAGRDPHRDPGAEDHRAIRHLRGAPARVDGLAARRRGGGARDGRRHREDGARRPRARGADAVRGRRRGAAALAGKKLDDATIAAAGEAAVAGAKPLSGNAYKVQLARVATRRALLRAAGREV